MVDRLGDLIIFPYLDFAKTYDFEINVTNDALSKKIICMIMILLRIHQSLKIISSHHQFNRKYHTSKLTVQQFKMFNYNYNQIHKIQSSNPIDLT